jgi:hypothetical protein
MPPGQSLRILALIADRERTMIPAYTDLASSLPQEAVAVLIDQGRQARPAWRCPGCGADVIFDALIISCRCADSSTETMQALPSGLA